MSYASLILAIAWPGAATHRDALLRIGWGASISWTELLASLWTVAFLVLFVRFAESVNRERLREQETTLVPFVKAAGILLLAATSLRAEEPAPAPSPAAFAVGGYVESFYSYNFDRPQNGITAFRGYDNQHDAFTIGNAVLDGRFTSDRVSGRVALQVGHTPDAYYLGEPAHGAIAGTGATGPDAWKYVQEATLAWKAPVGRGLTFDMGIFLSPIGPEVIPVKDNWNWSRSTPFYGLPSYHTGLRATYPVTSRWNVTAAVFNGWNSVTDNNRQKSVSLQGLYTRPDKVVLGLLYFGGNERPTGAPEGEAWRHLFDGHVTLTLTPRVSLLAHGDAGYEDNRFGTSSWRSGALSLRLKAAEKLYLSARGDVLEETVPTNSLGTASAIFFPADRVSSLTFTLDARPDTHLSIRLEGRRDSASAPIYYERASETPTRKSQTTLTLGMTAWF